MIRPTSLEDIIIYKNQTEQMIMQMVATYRKLEEWEKEAMEKINDPPQLCVWCDRRLEKTRNQATRSSGWACRKCQLERKRELSRARRKGVSPPERKIKKGNNLWLALEEEDKKWREERGLGKETLDFSKKVE